MQFRVAESAHDGEGLWGVGTLSRECFAVSFGLLTFRSPFLPKQNSTLFRFRPTSPIRPAKQFCPAALTLGKLSQHVLPKGVRGIPKGKGFMRRDKSLAFVRRITPVSPLVLFLCETFFLDKKKGEGYVQKHIR